MGGVDEEEEAAGRGLKGWWRRVRRRAEQWAYADGEGERLPMLRQQGSSTTNTNGSSSSTPRRLQRIPGAEPGMYLSPRARATLLRQEEEGEGGDAGSGSGSPARLLRSLPDAYHSIAVPRARPGE